MKGMTQGRGMPRSVQILRTNSSLISLCRGMALRLLSSGWCHQEWLPPSLNRVQPCWLRWRNKSRRFTGPALAPRRSCLQQHGLQRGSSRELPAAPLSTGTTANPFLAPPLILLYILNKRSSTFEAAFSDSAFNTSSSFRVSLVISSNSFCFATKIDFLSSIMFLLDSKISSLLSILNLNSLILFSLNSISNV